MEIGLEIVAGIATLTLEAPQRRNALTAPMARQLGDALGEVEENGDVCALVLRGAGGYFCAGGDRATLAAAAADPADDRMFRDMDALYQSFHQLGALSVPTVAAVRGGAVGAGLNLALATDVRIVGDDAVLRSGFLRIGAHPGGGHFGLMERLGGPQTTAAMTLLEQKVVGAEAVRLGLAWEAVEDQRVDARATELVAGVSDPELVRFATRSLRAQFGAAAPAAALALRAEQAGQMWSLRRSRG